MAKLASERLKNPIKLADAKVVEDRVVAKPKKNPADIQMEDKIKTALAVNKTSLGFDGRIKSCSMDYMDLMGVTFCKQRGTALSREAVCLGK
jgi:predicted Zn-dependent protease